MAAIWQSESLLPSLDSFQVILERCTNLSAISQIKLLIAAKFGQLSSNTFGVSSFNFLNHWSKYVIKLKVQMVISPQRRVSLKQFQCRSSSLTSYVSKANEYKNISFSTVRLRWLPSLLSKVLWADFGWWTISDYCFRHAIINTLGVDFVRFKFVINHSYKAVDKYYWRLEVITLCKTFLLNVSFWTIWTSSGG